MVTDLEFDFLQACHEAVTRQQELVPLLAQHLGLLPEAVIFHWRETLNGEQSGSITGTDWRYFFHGQECDLKNTRDGRFLRLDFGPNGRYDTFSGFGILQFIMTTTFPWREFAKLKVHLYNKPAASDELSGSHQRMRAIVKRLRELSLLEVADPELCALVEENTHIRPDGSSLVTIPQTDYLLLEVMLFNTSSCFNLVLSDSGKQLIGEKNR